MSNVKKVQKSVSSKNQVSTSVEPKPKRNINETICAGTSTMSVTKRPTPSFKKPGEFENLANASICVGSTSASSRIKRNLNETVQMGPSVSSTFRKPALRTNSNFKKPGEFENLANASICVGATSPSRIRRNLNETVRMGPSGKPPLTTKETMEDENVKLQLTFAYNEYLQSLMKELIIEQNIKKNKEVLDGQLQHYGQLLHTKKEQLDAIVTDTKTMEKKEKVVQTLNQFEEVLNKIKRFYDGHHINNHMEKLKSMLEYQSNNLFVKNVKPLKTQEDYDKFMDLMKTLLSTMDKFINSGRDFDMVNKYAEAIRAFYESRDKAQAACKDALQAEKDAITGLIANMSDMFAKKYELETSDDTKNILS